MWAVIGFSPFFFIFQLFMFSICSSFVCLLLFLHVSMFQVVVFFQFPSFIFFQTQNVVIFFPSKIFTFVPFSTIFHVFRCPFSICSFSLSFISIHFSIFSRRRTDLHPDRRHGRSVLTSAFSSRQHFATRDQSSSTEHAVHSTC